MTEVQNQHDDPITTENNSVENIPDNTDTTPVPQDDGDVSRETEREQEAEKPVKHWKDDKRAEMGERARELRAKEMRDFDGDLTDPKVTYGEDADATQFDPALRAPKRDAQGRFAPAEDAGQQEQEPQGQQPQGQQYPNDLYNQEVEINVYGQRRTVKVADLIANAQKNEAGDAKLREAREIVDNLKRMSELRQH